MKTTIDLERLSAGADPTWPPVRRRQNRGITITPTIKIGLILSVVAAITTIVLNGILQIPAVAIVMAVLIVGFALSWRINGQLMDE